MVVPLALLVLAAETTAVGVGGTWPLVVRSPSPMSGGISPSSPTEASSPGGPPSPRSFTMAFTGDILIHEQLWETAAARATGSDRFDFRPLFAQVRPVIAGADLAICHLETPLSPDDRDLSSYPVFETPSEVAEAIAWAGYEGCSTASNHSLDGGASGVVATLHWLDRAGLGHAGTARSWKGSRALTSYQVNGATVAHLSYSWGFNGFTPDHGWRANQIVVARVEAEAARARKAGADLVVVSLHWGAEYSHTPTPWQREVADLLTRGRDIDLVVGHHAHVVQPLHREHGTWVAYGLGNFLSGMTSSLGTSAVEDGVILVVKAERRHGVWRVSDVHVVPTWVEYGTWRILPIARTLARQWPSTSLRAALRASFARTITAVRLLGDDVRPTQSLVG